MTHHHFLRQKMQIFAQVSLICFYLIGSKMPIDLNDTRPRNQTLPLFDPHIADFSCEIEARKVPSIDAEADTWFRAARALESPDTLKEHDYGRIVQLTQQAAERHHWKAMLNLASLYLENRDPAHGVDDAVLLVEKAMQLGIPAAFDRMGIYYMHGTGVPQDATKAYAFMQRAAQMGSPQAMAFLAEKLNAGPDSVDANHWSNIPIATKMLECAFGQGYGPAAFDLHYLYASPRDETGYIIGHDTSETKARAVKVLHEGVRLGCAKCARNLFIEFSDPLDIVNLLVPYIDKARGERYRVLARELDFNPGARFPNIDKVVPLPPADLPPWNGDRDTLLAAAMGVTLPLTPAKTSMASNRLEPPHPDPQYKLRFYGEQTMAEHAHLPGYWQPDANHYTEAACRVLARTPPRAYRAGEPFDQLFVEDGTTRTPIEYVLWRHFHTLRHNHGAIEPLTVAGLTRTVPRQDALLTSNTNRPCPATGTWQPWIDVEHPMAAIVNQSWRQAWLTKGQAFPEPEADWLLTLPAADVTWYLLDDTGIDIS
jgi:hypothetical protein